MSGLITVLAEPALVVSAIAYLSPLEIVHSRLSVSSLDL
jgi:hypothetical protein